MLIAIRGATTVEEDTEEAVMTATEELLRDIVEANALDKDDIVSIIFTATCDIRSCFPAAAARNLGWTDTPLMCARELDVAGSISLCIRVMMHVDTTIERSKVNHIYRRKAVSLRPDLIGE